MQNVNSQFHSYQHSNSIIWDFTFLRKWSFFKKMENQSTELVLDSIKLYNLKMGMEFSKVTEIPLEQKKTLIVLTNK